MGFGRVRYPVLLEEVASVLSYYIWSVESPAEALRG
jgi:hypothetical protein